MSIYIEYVILDNLVINTLILLCVRASLHLASCWWKILLSALLGTIIAVILPLFGLSSLASIPIKLALGLVMVLIISKYARFRDYLFTFLLFIGYTFLLGGACIATLLAFGTDLDLLASGGYDIALPLGIIFLIVSVYVWFIIALAKYLSRRRSIAPYVKKVVLCLSKHYMEMNAFMDTGNSLVDKMSGMPVIILTLDQLLKHFSASEVEDLMLNGGKSFSKFRGVHKIGYSTISGEAKDMVVFRADKLIIKGQEGEYTTNRFMVGITTKKFRDAMDYQMLLNPALM